MERVGLIAAALCGLAACLVEVDYTNTHFRCDRDQRCPAGQVCGADGFCDEPGADAGDTGLIRGPGSWSPTAPSPLAPRQWIDAVWTGSELLVIGGAIDDVFTATDTGASYDPATDTWTELAPIDIGARHTVTPVWTGNLAVFWGGGAGPAAATGGSRYDPATNSWAAITETGSPGARIYATSLWTGDRLLVWGGWSDTSVHLGTGSLYDPIADVWTPMSTTGAPSARSFAAAVWTGQVAIIWGGCSGPLPDCATPHGDGAMYNPETDRWLPMSEEGAPAARSQASAVWTGAEMILFGGSTGANSGDPVNTGYIFDPADNSWRPISTDSAPTARTDPAAAWAGDKMLVWGGAMGATTGFLYDPVADAWSPMENTAGRPDPRSRFAYGVTGDNRLFVWGGRLADDSGAVWTPEP